MAGHAVSRPGTYVDLFHALESEEVFPPLLRFASFRARLRVLHGVLGLFDLLIQEFDIRQGLARLGLLYRTPA